AFRSTQRSLHGVRDALSIICAHNQTVDNNRDAVILVPLELGRTIELDQLTVHASAHKAFATLLLEQVAELTLAAAHKRREHLDLCLLAERNDLLDDFRRRLATHRPPARRAM